MFGVGDVQVKVRTSPTLYNVFDGEILPSPDMKGEGREHAEVQSIEIMTKVLARILIQNGISQCSNKPNSC